jgi:hypothetical protein
MNDENKIKAAKARDKEFRQRLAKRGFRLARQGWYFFVLKADGTDADFNPPHKTKPGYRMGLTVQEMEKTLKSIERSTAEVHKEDHHAYHPQND